MKFKLPFQTIFQTFETKNAIWITGVQGSKEKGIWVDRWDLRGERLGCGGSLELALLPTVPSFPSSSSRSTGFRLCSNKIKLSKFLIERCKFISRGQHHPNQFRASSCSESGLNPSVNRQIQTYFTQWLSVNGYLPKSSQKVILLLRWSLFFCLRLKKR